MDYGWVKLHRKIMSNPIYRNSAYFHVWMHLLLKASHYGDKIMWNGGVLEIKEGQCVIGRKKIALETNVPESTVERALKWLEKEGQIEQLANSKFRVITILNWKEYQATEQQTDSKRTASGQPADTFKNVKKEKNVKKDPSAPETGDGELITQSIDLFKDVNQSYRLWYARPPQRAAIHRLLEINGFDRLSRVIALLPKTNQIPYLPTITTPIQLEERWAALESGLIKKKGEITSKGRGLA
jgi:hypothetical protein